jgi:hypothetical protein
VAFQTQNEKLHLQIKIYGASLALCKLDQTERRNYSKRDSFRFKKLKQGWVLEREVSAHHK